MASTKKAFSSFSFFSSFYIFYFLIGRERTMRGATGGIAMASMLTYILAFRVYKFHQCQF